MGVAKRICGISSSMASAQVELTPPLVVAVHLTARITVDGDAPLDIDVSFPMTTEWIPKRLAAAKAKFAEYLEHEVGNL
jgi:hypothetical protein